ncbi:MAG: TIGR00282 family metallophosphoesterase [Candidatus Cloacimonetes bacterium]|nr:TIGR00282 family metallophosphoesterase [Candidatus Cloacimonadota bacterium]
MNILFFGDVFGRPGRRVVKQALPGLKAEFGIDISILNCENLASGRGVTRETAKELFDAGIDLFSSGNHLWDRKQSIEYITGERRIVKPLNYPQKAAGAPWAMAETPSGARLALVVLVGQSFMPGADSPLTTLDRILPELQEQTPCILVDFHAESTAEKRALGFYADGRVSAVIGTHTHIQTADEHILPQGAAYITDVGMTGPHDSVIGVEKEIILYKMTTGMPRQYEVARDGLQINAVVVEVDDDTGRAVRIERIRRTVNL